MGSLNPFKKPKAPPPVIIRRPEAPPVQDTVKEVGEAVGDEKERLKKQRGRAATILTGGRGSLGDDGGVAT